MKIEKINYQRAYVTGPFLQDKMGMEISIDADKGETPEAAYSWAKEIMDNWHKANNPHLEGTTVADVPVTKVSFAIDEEAQYKIDQEFAQAVDALSKIEFQEDAIKWMNNNGWTFNMELKQIANSKPKKQ